MFRKLVDHLTIIKFNVVVYIQKSQWIEPIFLHVRT